MSLGVSTFLRVESEPPVGSPGNQTLLPADSALSASTIHMATLSPPHCSLLNSEEMEVSWEALTLSSCKTHSAVENSDSCQ